ncbi:peptide ABC transporter substrate-binding protein [Furfurilactobacillus milii]|uniref:Peptide ABC transporter substrate-binding protein n=1 Tax=Furfurilactobacillus milii TaxID=2888272 RepID=A0A6N9I2T7_9LACO|nr:peptide ABC transporter substrate-binding protein [Furfurilactobacillus milii]MYV16696.1 peptide ABC transporter substrate-binding protein [Furfurilactobacillus milii]
MKRFTKFALIVSSLLTATSLAACHRNTTSKKTIIVVSPTEMITLDPSKATDSTSHTALANTMTGLYKTTNSTPAQALATHTTVSKNGLQWNFTLRHNTHWSNGDVVTAKDFVQAWQRTNDPKTASQYAYLFSGVHNADKIQKGLAPVQSLGIHATSRYHLLVTLDKPIPYFKQLLTMPQFLPQDHRVVTKYGKQYGLTAQHQVYNGAFKVTGWHGTNNTWTLKRNGAYWDKRTVHLNSIHFTVVKDPSTALNLYKTGKADLVRLSGTQVANEKQAADYKYRSGAASGFVGLNQTKKSPLQNQSVRQALSNAINRQQLTRNTLQDGSTPATGFTPAKLVTNPSTHKDFASEAAVPAVTKYDMAHAKQLMATGLKESGKQNLNITLLANDQNNGKQLAEYLQSQWQKLPHVTVNVQTVPLKAQLSDITSGNYDATILTWNGDFNDPTTFLSLFQSQNKQINAKWTSTAFDHDMDLAAGQDALNSNARYQDLLNAQRTLTKDVGIVPLFWGSSVGGTLQRSNIRDLVYSSAGVNYNYQNVELK